MSSWEFDGDTGRCPEGHEFAVIRVSLGDELTFCFPDDFGGADAYEHVLKTIQSWFPNNTVRIVAGVTGIAHSPKAADPK